MVSPYGIVNPREPIRLQQRGKFALDPRHEPRSVKDQRTVYLYQARTGPNHSVGVAPAGDSASANNRGFPVS